MWDAVARLRSDKLDIVPIESQYSPVAGIDAITTATFGPVDMSRVKVTVVQLTSSKRPHAAGEFGDYMASGKAKGIWAEQGFTPTQDSSSTM